MPLEPGVRSGLNPLDGLKSPTHSAGEWTGGSLRVGSERRAERDRSRRRLVLVQSRLLAPDLSQHRVLDAAGRLFDLGSWFAAELAWLQKDLEENHAACTLAYWHQPTFSATNGISPEGIAAKAFWQLLYEHRADLVLNGHDHLYARYRPLDPSGNFDPQRGLTEFIVGTGGETLDPVVTTAVTSGSGETNLEDPSGNTNFNAENLVAATGDYWGVMALTLDQNGYGGTSSRHCRVP